MSMSKPWRIGLNDLDIRLRAATLRWSVRLSGLVGRLRAKPKTILPRSWKRPSATRLDFPAKALVLRKTG